MQGLELYFLALTASVPREGETCNCMKSLTRAIDLQKRKSWDMCLISSLRYLASCIGILFSRNLLRILLTILKNHIFTFFNSQVDFSLPKTTILRAQRNFSRQPVRLLTNLLFSTLLRQFLKIKFN